MKDKVSPEGVTYPLIACALALSNLRIPELTLAFHTSLPFHMLFHMLGEFLPLFSTCLTSLSLIFHLSIIPSEILGTIGHLVFLTPIPFKLIYQAYLKVFKLNIYICFLIL